MTNNLQGKKITDLEVDNPTPDLYESIYVPVASGNNTKRLSLQQIIDMAGGGEGASGGGFIGQFAYGLRTDAPTGCLRCDGNEYPSSAYAYFISQYLLTGKIKYMSLEDYQTQLDNNNDNCGYFGYNDSQSGGDGSILRVPRFKDSIFIAQALTAGNIGKFNEEGLPNITGTFNAIRGEVWATDDAAGAFSHDNVNKSGPAGTNPNARVMNFNASLSNPIYGNSEHVTPNHMQYPLFVCVNNAQEPAAEAQYNQFIDGLNNKVNVDGSNIQKPDFQNNLVDNDFVKRFIPNYSSGTTFNGGFIAPSAGLISVFSSGSSVSGYCNILINNVAVGNVTYNGSVVQLPVKEGYIIAFNGSMTPNNRLFFPYYL